jgi:nitroreductase
MNVIDAIQTRKSVRQFLSKPVEDDKLQLILSAARLAPSASNRQEWRFVVVRDPETRQRLADAARGQQFVGEAPVVIVACAATDDHIMPCGLPCFSLDVAIALDHITLAAVEQGLGTCWIGAFHQDQVKQILGIPDEIRVVELMPLGYPADPTPIEKRRLPLTTIVHNERW